MSEVLPIQSLPPDEPIPNPHQNPNPNPNPNPSIPQCEALGRSWLFSLPHPHSPSPAEIDAWIESNLSSLPSDFSSLPRAQLHRWILSLNSSPSRNPNPSPSPNPSSSQAEHPYRFQRTDLWLPVYEWLESLDKDQLVSGKEITDWLAENTEFRDRVLSRHSKYHLMHYIQKLHLKVLKKRGKLPKGERPGFPSISVMEFCSENLLACGSDCEHGGPAVVQLWDFDSPQSCLSFPANDSYITSLKANPVCNVIMTGSGDGTIGLFDIRTCDAISHLSIGSGYEVTSVSFSSCGTYFSASSTSNSTLVWDTRLMPTNRCQMPLEKSCQVTDSHFFRPLHCLSHGKQMPTAEHAGQLPGHVDEGDQGVNDAQWLQREPVLVTESGDGSIAMWDVTLGVPCVRHLVNHTRSVNTVAVAPNDEYLCSGGDDQKIVMYHNKRGTTRQKWRLSHPLS